MSTISWQILDHGAWCTQETMSTGFSVIKSLVFFYIQLALFPKHFLSFAAQILCGWLRLAYNYTSKLLEDVKEIT